MPDEKPIDATGGATGEAKATDSTPTTVEPGESQGATDKERTDWKALYLTSKGKVERVNDLERENEELRRRAVSPPTGYATDPQYQAQVAYQQRIQQLQSIADRDPAAAAILDQMQINDQNSRRLQAEIELSRISSESEREGVVKYLQTGDYRTVAAARKAYLGDQLETREKEREAQAQKERDRREAEKAKNSSPDTVSRTPTANGNASGMRESQWLQDLKVAREKGDFAELRRLRSPDIQNKLVPD